MHQVDEILDHEKRSVIDHPEDFVANRGKRFLNYLIDTFLCYALLFSTAVIFFAIFDGDKVDENSDSFVFAFYGVLYLWSVLYYSFFESWKGKSPAKFLTNTTVVSKEGKIPTFSQALGRSLARLIPFEAFSFLGSEVGLHDSLSKTYVIDDKKALW